MNFGAKKSWFFVKITLWTHSNFFFLFFKHQKWMLIGYLQKKQKIAFLNFNSDWMSTTFSLSTRCEVISKEWKEWCWKGYNVAHLLIYGMPCNFVLCVRENMEILPLLWRKKLENSKISQEIWTFPKRQLPILHKMCWHKGASNARTPESYHRMTPDNKINVLL